MFKNLIKKKEKERESKDHFQFVIFDDNMRIIAGVNNIELAKSICNLVAHDSKETFYITTDTGMRVYCLENEQHTGHDEDLSQIEAFIRARDAAQSDSLNHNCKY